MAGDWLKLECSTPEKSETLAITAAMGWTDPDLTVGKLFRVWRWFDQHTVDGRAGGVTTALLDRIIGAPGFTEAMRSVAWLVVTEDGITLPNFDRHNGSTAKARALTAKRVSRFKLGNGEGNGDGVTKPLPREEKKREEKKKTGEAPPAADAAPGEKPEERKGAPAEARSTRQRERFEIPVDFQPSPEDRKWARDVEGLSDREIDYQTSRFIRHHRGRGNRFKRPDLAWRNWISERFIDGNRNSGKGSNPGQPTGAGRKPPRTFAGND